MYNNFQNNNCIDERTTYCTVILRGNETLKNNACTFTLLLGKLGEQYGKS